MKCRKSVRVAGLVVVLIALCCVAWDRNEMSIFQLRVNTIRGANDTDTITIVNPLTITGAQTFSGAAAFSSTVTVAGDLTVNSDTVMEQDAILRNDVADDVEVIFGSTNAVLGQLVVDTSVDQSTMADNDLYEFIFRGPDTASNATDYAVIQGKITDNTTATENGQLIIQTTASGTDVTGLTIGHNASGTHACTIVPAVTMTGGFDANAASTMTNLTLDAGSTFTPGASTITLVSGLVRTIDATTCVTSNQTFLSSTGVTNTLVIVDGIIKAIN